MSSHIPFILDVGLVDESAGVTQEEISHTISFTLFSFFWREGFRHMYVPFPRRPSSMSIWGTHELIVL